MHFMSDYAMLTRLISQQTLPPPRQQPTFGATPTFAPRPQPSTMTPILTQTIDEDEPQVIKSVEYLALP
jgi:hypothetical protein